MENSAGVSSSLLIRVPASNKLWQMLCENPLSKLKLDPRISLYSTKLLTTAMAHRSLKISNVASMEKAWRSLL